MKTELLLSGNRPSTIQAQRHSLVGKEITSPSNLLPVIKPSFNNPLGKPVSASWSARYLYYYSGRNHICQHRLRRYTHFRCRQLPLSQGLSRKPTPVQHRQPSGAVSLSCTSPQLMLASPSLTVPGTASCRVCTQGL